MDYGLDGMKWIFAALFSLSRVAAAAAGPVDAEVVRAANWLVGSFDTRKQAEADTASGTAYRHDVASMIARPLQDPVVFGDALYIYVENRTGGDEKPYRQRVYRLTKSGRSVKVEIFKLASQVLAPLVADPQMLANLAPGDLTKETGCDVILERNGAEFTGSTGPRSCKSAWKGSAYVTSSMWISTDLVVTLDRGYDANGVQTFGPTDGRGYEFRRVER